MISHEDPIEESIQRDTVEHNNQYQLKHIYPKRIIQLYWDINQVESAATTATIHLHWLMNIHEQVKATLQVIYNCLKYNTSRMPKTMTKHNYLTNMANAIVDDETGKELNYRQLSKHPKHHKMWKQSVSGKLGILAQGA